MLKCHVGTLGKALDFGTLTILAVTLYASPDLPHGKFAGKIIIDAGNYHSKRDDLNPSWRTRKSPPAYGCRICRLEPGW